MLRDCSRFGSLKPQSSDCVDLDRPLTNHDKIGNVIELGIENVNRKAVVVCPLWGDGGNDS